ncbi:MAG: hypothetical protein ACTSP4_05700 [Candidatus Hodarchaeales archaeon]
MMIVSLTKITYDELTKQLTKDDKIIIWTCNLCIKLCRTGGEVVAEDLAKKLLDDGYNVIHVEPIGYGCHMGLVRDRTRDPITKPIFQKADTIISIVCTDGNEKVARVFRKGKKIIDVTETVGVGAYSSKTGMRLQLPLVETGLKAKPEGITLKEAAKKLKMSADPIAGQGGA